MQKLLSILLFIFLGSNLQAQDSTRYRRIFLSVFDIVNALPHQGFGSMFRSPVHPGVTFGTELPIRTRTRSEWYQTGKIGYFYHAHVQHAVQLYTETGYRCTHKSGFGGFAQLGVGYVHSFADQPVFVFKDGEYKKKFPSGRAQWMLTLTPGIHYDFIKKTKMPMTVFFAYQTWFQFPYVKKYVTILPNVAFHVGVVYKLKRK